MDPKEIGCPGSGSVKPIGRHHPVGNDPVGQMRAWKRWWQRLTQVQAVCDGAQKQSHVRFIERGVSSDQGDDGEKEPVTKVGRPDAEHGEDIFVVRS